jgi:hypothetical protein
MPKKVVLSQCQCQNADEMKKRKSKKSNKMTKYKQIFLTGKRNHCYAKLSSLQKLKTTYHQVQK